MINNLGRIGELVGVCGEMQIARRLPVTNPKREISSLVRGSKVYWRGRSSAVSVPSDVSKVHKSHKKVPKDERRAMVEAFVKKYRAMNAGKFPSVKNAKNQVGGSYYTIREIIQELEYKSKMSSMNARSDNILGKQAAKVNETSIDVKKASVRRVRVDIGIHKDARIGAVSGGDIGDSDLKNVRGGEGPETSTLFEKTVSEEVVKPKMDEAKLDYRRYPENLERDMKERSHSESKLDLDGRKPKSKLHQQSPDLDKFARDESEKQIDGEPPKKSSMWGNLKSLADGIINMWKKL